MSSVTPGWTSNGSLLDCTDCKTALLVPLSDLVTGSHSSVTWPKTLRVLMSDVLKPQDVGT